MNIPLERISVIYCIWNNINDECYIGSAKDYRHRILVHIRQLNTNKHHCKHLQNAWNKYGESNFEVFILRKSNVEDLIEDEQWCFDILRPLYNICKIAGNTLGLKWTPERRIKQLKYMSNKSKKHIENFKKSIKNNKLFIDRSIEKCKIMTENNKVSVILLDINNNFIKDFSSIKDCSIYLKSTSSSIRYYLSGKAKGNFRNKYKFKIK